MLVVIIVKLMGSRTNEAFRMISPLLASEKRKMPISSPVMNRKGMRIAAISTVTFSAFSMLSRSFACREL